MRARHTTVVVGLLAALAQPPGTAQAQAQTQPQAQPQTQTQTQAQTQTQTQSQAIRQLIEQGQYWASRGDDQRAAEAWGRALRSDPDQPDALYGLAMIELGNKRMTEGQALLGQLKRMHPDSPLAARLEQEITLRGGDAPRQIDKARELAQAGDADGAVAQYRSALAGKAPHGPMALEYYQTLGYTEQGWDDARRGLEQLARQSPDDYPVKLALAQLLINRESTRAAGIRQLQQLSTRPDVGGVATESLRQALSWAGTPPRAGVSTRTRPASTAPRAATHAARDRVTAGLQAIESNDLVLAESHLQAVLATQPNHADALGGMGVIRLRQEHFVEARDLLQKAKRQAPGARWGQVLDTATYWALVQQGAAANQAGDTTEASRLLTQAIKLDAKETTADTLLGNVQAQQGLWAAAEATFRSVLARRASDPDATRGLINVLSQNGKTDDALRLAERLPPEQQNQLDRKSVV